MADDVPSYGNGCLPRYIFLRQFHSLSSGFLLNVDGDQNNDYVKVSDRGETDNNSGCIYDHY